MAIAMAIPTLLDEGASLAIPVWDFVTATRGVATASTTGTTASHDVAQAPSASVHAPYDLGWADNLPAHNVHTDGAASDDDDAIAPDWPLMITPQRRGTLG